MQRHITTAAVAAFIVAATSAPVSAVQIRSLAHTGQFAPGTGGVQYELFTEFAINSAGQVFFAANLNSNPYDSGLFVADSTGHVSLLARVGGPAPASVPGLQFLHSLAHQPGPIPDDSGKALFMGSVSGNGEYGRGFWLGGAAGLQSIALAGEQAPGFPTGLVFWDFPQDYLHNLSGMSLFRASVVDPANPNLSNPPYGVFIHDDQNGLSILARSGMAAPGFPSGVQFNLVLPLAITNSGNSLFYASLSGPSINADNSGSIWVRRPDEQLSLLIRYGDAVNGLPPDVRRQLAFQDINNAAQMAVFASLQGAGIDDSNRHAVLSFSPGDGLSLVARTGDPAPGTAPGVHFFGTYIIPNRGQPIYVPAFSGISVLSTGKILFEGHLEGPGVDQTNNHGVWIGDATEVELLLRAGDAIPDMAAGTVLREIYYVFHNQLDEMILTGLIAGPGIDQANDEAIWQIRADHSLQLLLREGDAVAVAPGDVRTIRHLTVPSAFGNDDGSPSSFNDAGQLIVHANFTDGSRGLLLLDISTIVPEPSVGTVIVIALCFQRARARDRRR